MPNKMKPVYLDNGATTKVADEVVEAIKPFFTDFYGNASSLHDYGIAAKKALENARQVIACAINAKQEEIIFTSGGTESNNTGLKIAAKLAKKQGKNHIITSKIEHPSILNTCKALEKEGFKVSYISVNHEGIIDVRQLESSIRPTTAIVTIMHANNEIGTVQPIEEIGRICKAKGVIFHTDAVQSFTKASLDVKKFNVDMASLSAHKIHGPKGIGALYARTGIKLESYIHGGHQEKGRRAGTENIPYIAGFAKAVEISEKIDYKKMAALRDYMANRILNEIPHTRLNGSKDKRLQNNINISFDYIEGESLLMKLNESGIAVSTGSACSSQNLEPSHVLIAMGLTPVQAHGSIRFTLSSYTAKDEIDYTINSLKEAVADLRRLSPLGEKNV